VGGGEYVVCDDEAGISCHSPLRFSAFGHCRQRGKKNLCWFCVLVDVGETFVQAKPRNNLLAGDQF